MKTLMILFAGGLALPGMANAPQDAQKAAPMDAAADAVGTITGKITWKGDRPAAKPPIVMGEKESQGCVHHQGVADTADRSLLIDAEGGVANVVVTLEVAGMKPVVPAEPVALDQKGCRFEPHVIVVPVGTTLRFDNSDETNHNIHTYARKNQAVNKNVAGGSSFEQVLDKAEQIEVKCDVHPWMKGYVFVTEDARWSVTAENGSFRIEGVPPGEYTLSWWHEELGKGQTQAVAVEAGKEAVVTHQLGEAKQGASRRRR